MTFFASSGFVTIVSPAGKSGTDQPDDSTKLFRALLERERHEIEVELGAPVVFSDSRPDNGPVFLIGPSGYNPELAALDLPSVNRPTVIFDRTADMLIADGPDLDSAIESLSLLRTCSTTNSSRVEATDCETVVEVVDRVEHEVATTYPAFELRSLNWREICERHRERVLHAPDVAIALQEWIAELGDMHTAVRNHPPDGLLPYVVNVDPNTAYFVRVPEWTRAWSIGLRPGDEIIGIDTAGILARTGGPPHMNPYLAGRRLMSGPVDQLVSYTIRTRNGDLIEFSEKPGFQPWHQLIGFRRLPSGTGYLRIAAFVPGVTEQLIDALEALSDCHRLIVDLRGNAGGLLVEAYDCRDLFLDEPRTMGTIQYSTPDGSISRHFPIAAEPSSSHTRWNKPVRFLIDPLTASASEDFLLGLQQLPDVQLIGTPSGGGSGRPRMVRLTPHLRLTISTALTFDHNGRCIEGSGLEPDIPIAEIWDHRVIDAADRSW